jgi:hypothetical protein
LAENQYSGQFSDADQDCLGGALTAIQGFDKIREAASFHALCSMLERTPMAICVYAEALEGGNLLLLSCG